MKWLKDVFEWLIGLARDLYELTTIGERICVVLLVFFTGLALTLTHNIYFGAPDERPQQLAACISAGNNEWACRSWLHMPMPEVAK